MDLKRQELIVILISGKIKGEIFALGVCSHEGAEEEDDLVDVKHPSGRALIPSGPYHHECVVHLAAAAVEHKRTGGVADARCTKANCTVVDATAMSNGVDPVVTLM